MSKLFGRCALLALIGLTVLLPGAAIAQDRDASGSPGNERELLDQLGDARVYHTRATHEVSMIGADKQDAIARPSGLSAGASPEVAARAHLSEYGVLFGLRDQARELRTEETRRADKGRSLIRFQQVHDGVPVLGGEINVQVDDANRLLVANGEVLPDVSLDTKPAVSAKEARETALAKMAKDRGIKAGKLKATDPHLWIYDPTLLGGPGIRMPHLVWRTEVTPASGIVDMRELVLVDAKLGNVALHFDQIDTAKNRNTHDSNNTSALPGTLVCNESNPCTDPTYDADVKTAHLFAGNTYDFYLNNHNRDSLDNAGMTLVSTADYCDPSFPCPYRNAFWNGQQMVYGDGYAADDVVGHELTHGVTEHESQLFYYYQSGAINESLSDVWGEFIDLSNSSGTDTAATRWQLAEDIPGGALRDMQDPTTFSDPDKMTSALYANPQPDEGAAWDQGGVHTNSGVNNKAAYLMTDGDTFNGTTVTGLGITKVARIYYEAQANLLTSASDYQNLYAALQQSCANLTGTAGITSADCQEVKDAVDATEMNTIPPIAPNPEAPVCDTGQRATDLFKDDMETTSSGNWIGMTNVGTNPWGFATGYATSGQVTLFGPDQGARGDYSVARASGVTVPTNETTYLHFKHSYEFEDDSSGAYDGGVVEYSTNNGSTWQDAGSLFTHNGYNDAISSSRGNPLGGRQAFVRESNGYISSLANFSSLAGQNVRFRFRIGTDSAVGDFGWLIDDVRVYTCESDDTTPPAPPVINSPPDNSFDTDGTITLSGTAEGGSTVEVFDGATSKGTTPVDPTSGAWSMTLSAVGDGTHTYTAKATDAAGNTSGVSNSRTVIVDTQAPAKPATPDLDEGSDSGTSNSDDITNNNTPTFNGTAEADSTVKIYVDGVEKGSGTATGGSYSITTSALDDGPRSVTIKATDAAGNTSDASDALNVTIDTTIATPAAPDLVTASDSGSSNSDNITNDTTPTFNGTAEAGASVSVLVDGVEKGSGTATGGSYSITTSALDDDQHSVTVKTTDAAGNTSGPSNSRTVTVDTAKPQISNTTPLAGTTNVARGTNLTATFSEKMTASSVNTTTFKLFKVNSDGTQTRITDVVVSLSANGLKATLNPFGVQTPTLLLARNTKYKGVVTTGAKDLAGNSLAQQKSWTFTTKP
jgi:bacillolysin